MPAYDYRCETCGDEEERRYDRMGEAPESRIHWLENGKRCGTMVRIYRPAMLKADGAYSFNDGVRA